MRNSCSSGATASLLSSASSSRCILLVLLGSVYGDEPIEGVKASTYLLVGLLGYGVAGDAFASLAITLVVRREQGLLKRVTRDAAQSRRTYLPL